MNINVDVKNSLMVFQQLQNAEHNVVGVAETGSL